MLMKLLVNVFDRAKSKLTVTRSNTRLPSGWCKYTIDIIIIFSFHIDSDIEITNFDVKPNKYKSSIIQHQPRSSLSKWLCTTPISIDKPVEI
jgi:hypothetical protein